MTKDQLAALRVEFHQAINNHDWVATVHIGARLMSHYIDPTRLITEVYDDYAAKATTMRDTIRLQSLTNDTLRGQLERGGVPERVEAMEATLVSAELSSVLISAEPSGVLVPTYSVSVGEIVQTVSGPADFVLAAMAQMDSSDQRTVTVTGLPSVQDLIDDALKAPEEPGASR